MNKVQHHSGPEPCYKYKGKDAYCPSCGYVKASLVETRVLVTRTNQGTIKVVQK